MQHSSRTSGDVDTAAGSGGVRSLVSDNQTVAFFAVTLLLSWAAWLVAHVATGGDMGQLHLIPGAFGPMVAAVLVTWASGESVRAWAAGIVSWRVQPRWYLVALGLPLLLVVGSVGAILTLAGVPLESSRLLRQLPMYPLVLGFIFIVGGGQEEPGWRGFALPRLQQTYGALLASLVIGVVWAVWHLPLFAIGLARNASGNFLLYVVLVVGLSILLTWCYNSTGGSVLLAMLFHASMNTAGGLLPVGEAVVERTPVLLDVGMIVGVWIVAIALVIWQDPATLSQRELPGSRRPGTRAETTSPE